MSYLIDGKEYSLEDVIQLTKERDQLAAKCAALQHVIQLAWEDRRDDSDMVYIGKLAEARCNDDLGQHWLRPHEAKDLADKLERAEAKCAEMERNLHEESVQRIGCEYAMIELRRCCGLDASKTDMREVKLYIDAVKSERDGIAAKVAEMYAVLWHAKNSVEVGYVKSQIEHALSDQCGVGWLSPEKKKALVEALERISIDPIFDTEMRRIAKQALEAAQ